MFDPDFIPAWVYLLIAASFLAIGVVEIFLRWRRRGRLRRRKRRSIRNIARLRTWNWLFDQRKPKRLGYRNPADNEHGA